MLNPVLKLMLNPSIRLTDGRVTRHSCCAYMYVYAIGTSILPHMSSADDTVVIESGDSTFVLPSVSSPFASNSPVAELGSTNSTTITGTTITTTSDDSFSENVSHSDN